MLTITSLVPPKAVPFQVRPVTSWKGRVEISCPAAATPMMTLVPHPLWQASKAALCHQETISGQHHISLIRQKPPDRQHNLILVLRYIAALFFINAFVFAVFCFVFKPEQSGQCGVFGFSNTLKLLVILSKHLITVTLLDNKRLSSF